MFSVVRLLEAFRVVGLYSIHTSLAFGPIRSDPLVWLGVKGDRAVERAADVSDGLLLSVLSAHSYVRYVRARIPAE